MQRRKKLFYVVQEGKPEATKCAIEIIPDEITWYQLMLQIQATLHVQEIEGLYDESGLQYWRIATIPVGILLYARLSQASSLFTSLSMDPDNDEQLSISSWDIVQDARNARIHLRQVVEAEDALDGDADDLCPNEEHLYKVQNPVSLSPTVEQIDKMEKARADASIKGILSSMQQYPDTREIQLVGTRMLCEITTADAEAPMQVIALGGVPFLCRLLRSFPDDENLGLFGNWVFSNIMPTMASCAEDGEIEILQTVVASLRQKKTPRIAKYGLMVFSSALETMGRSVLRDFPELRVLEAVFDTMEFFPENTPIYGYCLSILRNIITSTEIRLTTQQKAQMIAVAEDTRERFYENEKLQMDAQYLLENISNRRHRFNHN